MRTCGPGPGSKGGGRGPEVQAGAATLSVLSKSNLYVISRPSVSDHLGMYRQCKAQLEHVWPRADQHGS